MLRVSQGIMPTPGDGACCCHMSPAAAAVVQVEEPAKRKGGVILGSVAELVDRLRNEAKVL